MTVIALCLALQTQLPGIALPHDLQRVLSDYESAWQAKSPSKLAALFAEDGFVLSPGKPPVRGRIDIEKNYQGAGGDLALRPYAYKTEGHVGYIIGGYAAKKGTPDEGKFTLTLVKDATGRWLIMSDMDNGNKRN